MSIALVFRRSVQSMYFMTQSVRTKLIQQQFGQYMDKSFRNMKDIKDVYEWMEGPLVDAVQCDVNGDTQCIIERSFRQIGRLSFVLWLPDLFCGFVFVVCFCGGKHTHAYY
tara:strand:- start:177 stop:509 length:333 start_codon:yes stop_codon:yes gene_type:complete